MTKILLSNNNAYCFHTFFIFSLSKLIAMNKADDEDHSYQDKILTYIIFLSIMNWTSWSISHHSLLCTQF